MALAAQYPDILRSLGIGASKGGINVAGLLGDLSELGAQGLYTAVTGIGGLLGRDWRRSLLRPEGRVLGTSPFGSKAIRRGIESNVTSPFYTPQTRAGEFAESGGRTAVEMVAGAPILNVLKRGTELNIANIERNIERLRGMRK